MSSSAPSTVDEYLGGFSGDLLARLRELRRIVRSLAPDAEEKISYQMPSFHLNGYLVHFAGYAKHIGFYPGASAISRFKSELAQYRTAKGSVQFPLSQPLPTALIRKILQFRIDENRKKAH